jgi:AcrR family transcriptional regulator
MTLPVDPTTDQEPPKRKQPRGARRAQLIEATVDCLAQHGFARTTMSAVANTAGLSHGLVNFHFVSKDMLFVETLRHLAGEYRAHWIAALDAAPKDAAAQLHALLDADFRPPVCTPQRLAAWGAFWGEAQTRPIYREQVGANDREYNDRLEAMVQRMLDEHLYPGRADRMARVLRVLAEGVWLDMMTKSQSYGPEEARATVMTGAAGLFPRHFCETGLITESDPIHAPDE